MGLNLSCTYSKLSNKRPVLLNNQKVSVKQPVPSQKKSIVLFNCRATTANSWSLLNNLVWVFKKNSIKTTSTIYFSNFRGLDQPAGPSEGLKFWVRQ